METWLLLPKNHFILIILKEWGAYVKSDIQIRVLKH